MPKNVRSAALDTGLSTDLHHHAILELPHGGHSHEPVIASQFLNLDLRPSKIDLVSRVIAGLTGRVASPWLIIIVRFSDDRAPVSTSFPHVDPLYHYKRVFTKDGRGELNLVDYFLDMSHGLLDLTKTSVVGPYKLARARADYVGNVYPQPDGKLNRNGVLDLGKAAAAAHGIDLTKFAGVVVCGTPTLDLCGWVGGMAALSDDLGLAPSLMGQEMGHGYGLDHSRRNGSSDDYLDPWDTMSTANAHSAPHSEFGSVGPGLNAWNMRMRGWLDEDRVVTINPGTHATVTLKPLHDRPFGTIAIDLHGFLIEFRMKERWDAAIPRSCVLVHRSEGNQSYVMTGTGGNYDLVQNDRFEWGLAALGQYISLEVVDIDEATRTATINVAHGVVHIPQYERRWPIDFNPLPPVEDRSILHRLVDHYEAAREVAERHGKPELQLEALGNLVEQIGRMARNVELTTFHQGYSFDPDARGKAREPALASRSQKTAGKSSASRKTRRKPK